ncbi:hypothetical protein [Rhabdothermincola salaria]|uniref:hypothetical protein n=1 Tax=Rhabdothermincola salaria TaxID=2903142 RepID=UPI001E6158B9|nr:hypothetical protein [Rhabdothermincola salaria]MCD9625270.1 hypothetical protein [Rhabdothermincola salaria]
MDAPNLAEDPSLRPPDWDDKPDIARHWWQDVGGADAIARSAHSLLSTLIEVYRPGEVPLEVETFPTACQVWAWEDGVLEALDT